MKKPLTNMRVLLLAALAATAYGAGHIGATVCDEACVAAIFTKIPAAATLGYADGDLAVYGYMLYVSYTHGDTSLAYVDAVLGAMATECGNDGTAAKMKECLTAATADDVDEVKTYFDGLGADDKAAQEMILGAVANQIASGSLVANQWGGLDTDTYNAALKVFYIVGAFGTYVNPYIEHAFSDATKKDACNAQLYTAISYTTGGDLAAAIAEHGDKLFGATGLKHASCFGGTDGAGATACEADNFAAVTIAGESVTYANCGEVITALDGAYEEATAEVLKFTAADDTATDPSDASPAAALTTLIAAIALML